MYRYWQNYTFNSVGENDVCELYYWSANVSVGHPAGALTTICRWVLLTWLTYALWDTLLRWCSSWRVFTHPMCMPIISLDKAHQLMCVYDQLLDQYIIKWHVSHAWYWFWIIKALVEAVVLWWLYIDFRGHSSTVDHCQTFSVFLIRLAKQPVLKAKMLYWHCLCMYFICGWKEPSSNDWQKSFYWKKGPIG